MSSAPVVSGLIVKIIPNDRNNPPGKLADAELHFDGIRDLRDWLSGYMNTCQNPNAFGPLMTTLWHLQALDGLKLIGFGIWERRAAGGRNVTFPARQYSVNGERRSFALLRPILDTTAQDRIRELILDAYAEYEAQAANTEGVGR